MNLVFSGTENPIDMVGEAAHYLQQAPFAGGLEEGDARFNHMPAQYSSWHSARLVQRSSGL